MPDNFSLHPKLAADTLPAGDLPLSRLLLMNDTRFPWLILVPRRNSIREIFELSKTERAQLMDEIAEVSHAWQAATNAEKMNVAALGNMVPQLHIHIIARFAKDAAWPNPVWGTGGTPAAYTAAEAEQRVGGLVSALSLNITKM